MVEVFYRKRTISVIGCMVQMNTTVFLGGTESFLLAVMAYDRYVAICFPLHYTTIMSRKNCRNITIVMWSGSLLTIVVPSNLRPMLFCLENKLDHFACETMAVQALECGDLTFHKVTRFVVSIIALVVPLVYIIVSYILIILSILKIKSTDGRFKAFSTCASHLTVVSMFYGTTIAMYIWPIKMFSSHLKYIAVVYGIITPMLNPLIYSLRNNDVKEAFKKIITTIF
ncbi:olfactory receptor 2K2-like [Gastrophryne carolinensis]